MLCNICGKNPATVHLTEIVDDQMNELHLCEGCARQKSVQMEQKFGLSDLLAGMVDFEKKTAQSETQVLKCPKCKLTYSDFKKIGRLGCGSCYTAFSDYLAPLLRKIHGSGKHLGKSPLKASKPTKKRAGMEELRQKLAKAVGEEAFEDAAKLRDQIKAVEQKQSSKGK